MSNHTPAPWGIDTDGAIIGCQVKYKAIAEGASCEGVRIYNPADRDLILAAPDMYEALSYVMGFVLRRGCPDAKLYTMVSDALKKARGEQQ